MIQHVQLKRPALVPKSFTLDHISGQFWASSILFCWAYFVTTLHYNMMYTFPFTCIRSSLMDREADYLRMIELVLEKSNIILTLPVLLSASAVKVNPNGFRSLFLSRKESLSSFFDSSIRPMVGSSLPHRRHWWSSWWLLSPLIMNPSLLSNVSLFPTSSPFFTSFPSVYTLLVGATSSSFRSPWCARLFGPRVFGKWPLSFTSKCFPHHNYTHEVLMMRSQGQIHLQFSNSFHSFTPFPY